MLEMAQKYLQRFFRCTQVSFSVGRSSRMRRSVRVKKFLRFLAFFSRVQRLFRLRRSGSAKMAKRFRISKRTCFFFLESVQREYFSVQSTRWAFEAVRSRVRRVGMSKVFMQFSAQNWQGCYVRSLFRDFSRIMTVGRSYSKVIITSFVSFTFLFYDRVMLVFSGFGQRFYVTFCQYVVSFLFFLSNMSRGGWVRFGLEALYLLLYRQGFFCRGEDQRRGRRLFREFRLVRFIVCLGVCFEVTEFVF